MVSSRTFQFVVLMLIVMMQGQTQGLSALSGPVIEAQRLLDAGQPAEAVRSIKEHSPEADRDADLWFLLAESYQVLLDEAGMLKKRGLAKKMKRALTMALEVEPAHVDARRELADFYFHAPWIVGGSTDEAAKQLELLERVAPAEAHAKRGEYAKSAGEYKVAREHYRKAVDLGPRSPERLVALAVLEQQLESYADSIALLDEVIAQDPHRENAYFYRARASALAGIDIDRGLECARYYLEHCSKCNDSVRGRAWWRLATLHKRNGETDAAIAAYREALRYDAELDGARKGLEELEG
jgi:predicted Zn-dependent protease